MGHRRRTKRIKRAHMKMYSAGYINVGKGPNPIVLAEYKARARNVDDLIWKMFNFPGQFPNHPSTNGRLNAPRAAVLRKIEELTNKAPIEKYVLLEATKFTRTFLILNSECCFLIRKDTLKQLLVRSVHYNSRENAIYAFKHKCVTWVQKTSFIPPEIPGHPPLPQPG